MMFAALGIKHESVPNARIKLQVCTPETPVLGRQRKAESQSLLASQSSLLGDFEANKRSYLKN